MNALSRRLDRLESKSPADPKPWARVIWNPDLETEAEAKARDLPDGFDGNVMVIRLVSPGSLAKEFAHKE